MLTMNGPILLLAETANTPTLMSEWGPLLGVAAGAILSGASQLIAGHVQRNRDGAREIRDRKRAAYAGFLQALDEHEIADAIVDTKMKIGPSGGASIEEISAALDAHVAAMHKFLGSYSTLQIVGSKAVCELAEQIKDELAKQRDDDEDGLAKIKAVHPFEKKIITAMRHDLGTRDKG